MKRVDKGWIPSMKIFLVLIQTLSTRLIKHNFYGQKSEWTKPGSKEIVKSILAENDAV